jgi:hypothetical protein
VKGESQMRFRVVLTTNKRIVTRYIEAETKEAALEKVPAIIEEEGLGKLKRFVEVIPVDENNRAIIKPKKRS